MKNIKEKANRIIELEEILATSKEDKVIKSAEQEIEYIMSHLSFEEILKLDEIIRNS